MAYKQMQFTKNDSDLWDDDENIYFNIKIDNLYKNTERPKLAQKNEKTSDILAKQSDYKCAVTFWNIRGQIPVFICPILEGTNPNINDTPFGVCYSFGGNDYSQRVIYAPDAQTSTYILPNPPSNNNGVQDLSSTYYYIYTFDHFIQLVNDALSQAYTAFNAVHPGIHNSPVYIKYDKNTGLMSFIAEYSYANQAGADIFLNALLINYFEAIRMDFYGYDQPDFKDFRLIMEHNATNENAYTPPGGTIPPPPANPPYIQMLQEYDCRYLWANVKSILFTSSSIQTRNEFIPQVANPNLLSLQGQTNSFNPNYRNILSYYDIIYDSSGTSGANWRQYLYYNPNVYKYIDLVSDEPLNSFDIEIFMQLTNGQLIPLTIPINSSVDLKLLFKRK